MGNNLNKTEIYNIFFKEILYQVYPENYNNSQLYYIDKEWYDKFCFAVNKKKIENEVELFLKKNKNKRIKISKENIFSPPENYILKKEIKTLSKEFNTILYYIYVDVINENGEEIKKKKIIDSSKYIKVSHQFYEEVNKQFKCVYILKYNNIPQYRKIYIINNELNTCSKKYCLNKNDDETKQIIIKYLNNNKYCEYDYEIKIYPGHFMVFINYYETRVTALEEDNKIEDMPNIIDFMVNVEEMNYYFKNKKYSEKSIYLDDLYGTMGIANIENNSYMNSCIQCLSNIFPLMKYFLSEKYKNDINYNNINGSKGNITFAFAELIKILWTEKESLYKIGNKECYYFDPNHVSNKKKVAVIKRLKDEIGNNELFYNDFSEHELVDFFRYLINIIHEDLNDVQFFNNININININENNESMHNLYKEKYKIFSSLNKSIMIDLFYGFLHTSIKCLECKSEYHFFDPFNIISFDSLKKEENNETNEISPGNYEFTLPGRNNFYFCKCIIIPYNNYNEKTVFVYPIKKKNYDVLKIKDLTSIICKLFNLSINDIIASIISNDNTYFKFICSGKEYLHRVLKNPNNLKIYFLQLNKKSSIELIKEMKIKENLLKFILQTDTLSNDDSFSNTKTFTDTAGSLLSNHLTFKKYTFIKVISLIHENEKFITLKIPKIMLISEEDVLKHLYIRIALLYKFSGEKKYNCLEDDDELFNEKIEDLNLFVKKKSEAPFILFYKIECQKNLDDPLNKEKYFYIPIPFSNTKITKFSSNLLNLMKKDDKVKNFYLRNYRIYIVLNEYTEQLKNLENSMRIENMKEINPYKEIENESKMKTPQNDVYIKKNVLPLKDLILSFTADEKYEKENNWYCEKCQKNVYALKKTLFYSLPDILIFHLERKINDKYYKTTINFPFDNLTLKYFTEEEKSIKKIYILIGIITYSNENSKEHYNAYCKNPILNKWFLFDDSYCYPIDNIEEEISYEKVYAIIYQKKNNPQ